MKTKFKCKFCGYMTDSINDLKEHFSVVHGVSDMFDSTVEAVNPDIEVALTIYFTKMVNAPIKFKLVKYNFKFRTYSFYMIAPKTMTFEQIESFMELRELFYSMDKASSLNMDSNYIEYPFGGMDIIYFVQISEDTVRRILNSV